MPKRFSNSVGVRFLKMNYDEVMSFLRSYAERHVRDGDARLVVLYGSLARGDYTVFSDADLLIIVDKAEERIIDRIPRFLEPKAPIDLEPRVLTIAEALKMAEEGKKFLETVFSEGILLAGDKKLYEKILKILRTSYPGHPLRFSFST